LGMSLPFSSKSHLPVYVKPIHETINVPVILYGYETCSLTLREEHGLRIFEKRLMRSVFGFKREEVRGDW